MTYEIKYEPVIIEGVEYPKYNIYYSDRPHEFHSTDGINGTVRDGYKNIHAPNWLGLEQSLRYSPLFGKAFTDATDKGLNLFMITLLNGKRGEASQAALSFAFANLGVTWTDQEIIDLNIHLTNNSFTIQL